jgi:hypothetical protein
MMTGSWREGVFFDIFIGVTRWRLGRYAGFSFDRNMLQGILWFDIVALFQLILLYFVRPIPLLEAFACEAGSAPICCACTVT